jgi:DMSO/TMAO reductase YedYZ molybdopterin-dependent catalytic subunit
MKPISRRALITSGLAAAGVAGLAMADRIAGRHGLLPPDCRGIYGPGEALTYAAHRLLTGDAKAREFSRNMISKNPFANEVAPLGDGFKKLEAAGFKEWRLTVDGMVAHPMALSLADLRSMPTHSQITEVVCEEGWSYVAEWIGTPLSGVLREAGVLPQARYLKYFSIQPDWSDSIDIADAHHPQTFLTMGMNDGELPVGFGGPLRLRVPRQLGYKSVKYITRITAMDSLKYQGDYAWFAGI